MNPLEIALQESMQSLANLQMRLYLKAIESAQKDEQIAELTRQLMDAKNPKE